MGSATVVVVVVVRGEMRTEDVGAGINNNYWFEPLVPSRSFESQDHK